MKTLIIKTLLALSTTLMLTAGAAAAEQDRNRMGETKRHHGPPDAEMRVARMSSMLELSDEQSAELLTVMQAVDQERETLHQKMLQLMEPEICDLQLRVEANVAEILTDEQLAMLEEKKQDRRHQRSDSGWRGMERLDCSAYQ